MRIELKPADSVIHTVQKASMFGGFCRKARASACACPIGSEDRKRGETEKHLTSFLLGLLKSNYHLNRPESWSVRGKSVPVGLPRAPKAPALRGAVNPC